MSKYLLKLLQLQSMQKCALETKLDLLFIASTFTTAIGTKICLDHWYGAENVFYFFVDYLIILWQTLTVNVTLFMCQFINIFQTQSSQLSMDPSDTGSCLHEKTKTFPNSSYQMAVRQYQDLTVLLFPWENCRKANFPVLKTDRKNS